MCIRIVISVAGLRDRLLQDVANIYTTLYDGYRDILRYSSDSIGFRAYSPSFRSKQYRHAVLSCKITEHDDPERVNE
jgi:hypothetical protein